MDMIEVLNATKKTGSVTAIDHISMRISESRIYCLPGRNGAGKTTFLKLLAVRLLSKPIFARKVI